MINILRGGEWVEDQLDDPIPLHVILYPERTPNLTSLATTNPSGPVRRTREPFSPWRQGYPDPAKNAQQMTLVNRQNKITDRR